MLENSQIHDRAVLGYLGANGMLYCSGICAASAGNRDARPVDEEDLDAMIADGGPRPGSLCPLCGQRFAVSWPGREAE